MRLHLMWASFLLVFQVSGIVLAEVQLDQIISRESPLFRCATARLTVGKDGFVYFTSESQGKGYCLRMSRDGNRKLGGEVVYAIHNATANRDGVIATANAHFNHSINLYETDFQKRVAADDFLVNDQVGWDAPSHVEATPNGDFVGIDQHRNRVMRIGVDGKVKSVYPVRAASEADWGKPNDFRFCEPLQAFYWLINGNLIRTGFDGATVWKVPFPVQYRWDVGSYGGFDVDDAGTIFFMEGKSDLLKRLDVNGQPLPSLQLEMGELKPTNTEPIAGLRVFGQDLVLRRASPTELFQVYDLTTGKRKHVSSINYERLTVTFPSLVWTNGEKVPVAIDYKSNSTSSPHFRIWMTPFGISDWHEIPFDSEGGIVVPSTYAGLYQFKVSPEVSPLQTDEPSEYLVREIIEVRRPNSQGTVAVVTPLGRTHYSAQQEIVQGRVIARTKNEIADKIEVRLRDLKTQAVIATTTVDLKKSADSDSAKAGAFRFDSLAKVLQTEGAHQLEVDVPELTCVPQYLVLKLGKTSPSDFRTILYGDYGLTSPQRNAWESADSATAHVRRSRKLGINQFVNRTQQLSLDFQNDDNGRGLLNRVKQRLQSDSLAVTPEKAEFGSAHHQIAGMYSANGWREFLILVYMDGGLPLGTGHDRRTPAQFSEAIQRFTQSFWNYSGFTGWAWVANWWLYELDAKFTNPEEKTKYNAALKTALANGTWDPILDQVEDRKFDFAVQAQSIFNQALQEAGRLMQGRPDAVERKTQTATAGPYRRPEVLPEINFANVDEIDVQYQAEQITTPDWVPHGVDISQRSGQPLWIHPELWNDFGTGEQILPMSWMGVMRGATGIGTAGTVPNWPNVSMESRLGYHGTATMFRSLNRAIQEVVVPQSSAGHHWTDDWKLRNRVGIVVSPRQLKIETFSNGIGSVTFSRHFEAYQSLLYANAPARFVSLEEIKKAVASGPGSADRIARYAQELDALLLVGQVVDLEPEWQQFLKLANDAGLKILADGTCRPGVLPSAEPLGLAFQTVEKEHSVNSDYAHYVYPKLFIANAAGLQKTVAMLKAGSRRSKDVATLVETQAANPKSPAPVVLINEYAAADDSRLVFVINNTPTQLSPGQLRKVGRASATRTPVQARLKFELRPNQRVVDLFAGTDVEADVTADLRDAYARIYRIESSARVPTLRPKQPRDQAGSPQYFGPHLRDIAISSDGSTALVNAFNWDENLYGLDLATGQVRFRKRIGDHFSYSPRSTTAGFLVQGYDLNSAEGYHLYSVDAEGKSQRRFALPAVPGCLTGWAFTAWIQDRVNNFAASPAGSWIAGSGNLGLAVWDARGELLWSEDWSRSKRQTYLLESLGNNQLLCAMGMTLECRQASTGQKLWSVQLADAGEVLGLHTGSDNRMVVVRTNAAGGQVFVVREGRVETELRTLADDVSLSSNGGTIAVTAGHQLKVFQIENQTTQQVRPTSLLWVAHGDDQLRFPRVSQDGLKIATCSEIGTLYVYSKSGQLMHERDEFSIVVPAWHPDGDLIVAGWTGSVARLDQQFKDRWRIHVRDGAALLPTTTIALGDRIAEPATSRLSSWAVASTKIPERPNLLAPNQFIARWMMGTSAATPVHPVNDLADGKFVDPTKDTQAASNSVEPWLSWYEHGMIESGWRGEFTLVVDTFNRQLQVDAITFVEDPTHPESWLRDIRCEYWNSETEQWVFCDFLTSDSAIHSHTLKQPIQCARLRFAKADGHAWPAGNVRLQELMLHGKSLGASHPDVVAGRSVAVLFDENVASVKPSYEHGHNPGLKFATGPDAFSGGNYITFPADRKFGALWQPPYGHMTPNWLFEIAEKPEAGQYRFLQFTVKSLSPETKGVTLNLAPAHYGGIAVSLGEPTTFEGSVTSQESASVPFEWHTVTVDLWKILPENQRSKPFNIGAMGLGSVGGPAAIDRIRLGALPKICRNSNSIAKDQ